MKDNEEPEEPKERSRPTTPKWWRPNYPPKTYYWEEIRRQREKGGYPWTLLDRDPLDLDANMSDNLYEPVNPPPLYGSGYNMRFASDTASLDGRVIDIPPEIDIITSEGLDGLDQPDFHDKGFDGEREWCHSDDDRGHSSVPKTGFIAGIRNRDMPKSGETSSVRPLVGKQITFAPEAEPKPTDQQVPTATPEPGTSKPSALDQLKEKAGRVKQRISKISLPVRPKFNNWTGIKLSKKKRKPVPDEMPDDEDDQEVPEVAPIELSGAKHGRREPLSIPQDIQQKFFGEPMVVDETARGTSEELPPMDLRLQTEVAKTKELEGAKITKELEAAKSGVEKDSAKVARSEEAARINKEKEAAKLAREAAKLAKEEEAARLAKEREAAKKAEEAAKAAKAKESAKPPIGLKELVSSGESVDPEAARLAAEQELELRLKLQEEENKRIREADKLIKQAAADELKKQKEEEKLGKEKTQEELKKIKAEEKAAKDEIRKEQRKQEAELRRARMVEELKMEIEQANKEQPTGETPEEQLERRLAALGDEFEQDLGPPSGRESKEPSVSPTPKKPSTGEVIKRKFAEMDFTKRFKRSRTPPPRPEPPKFRFSRKDKSDLDTENKLAAQYSREITIRKAEMDAERLHEPQIYVTQPSLEAESETHSEWIPPGQRSSEVDWQPEEREDEDNEMPQEKPKLGKKLKGIKQGIGQRAKVIGHDLKKFGGKVSVKYRETVKEIKDTQERKRIREARDAEQADGENLPRHRFRFKRRGNEEQEVEVQRYQPVVVETVKKTKKRGIKQPPAYENSQEIREQVQQSGQTNGTSKIQRSQVIGRSERDWESLEDGHSREVSEEPNFSGNISSGRDSPLGSSRASSSVQHGRRQGVMEEIDSDEFFLRERGISEGEDEELLNRILVEELRQTFRPQLSNALNDFDLPTPPAKPSRSPKKPPRKEKENAKKNGGKKSPNFQTFPPERPKRKQTPGYVSAYLQAADNEEDWNPEDEIKASRQAEPEIFNESEEEEDEGLRRVKDELRKIDRDMEDEGRYEPITSESPERPQRAKRKKTKTPEPEPPQIFYYNTIGGNEWLKDLEDQINGEMDLTLVDETPVPPKRDRRKSEGKSETHSQLQGTSEIDDSELQFADDEDVNEPERHKHAFGEGPPLAQAESVGQMDDGVDSLDYMDEAGYSLVQKNKESPTTVPRRKGKGGSGGGSPKKNSLKRRSNQPSGTGGSGPVFFSLPRYTPRTFHIVPPTRPHRTYSTLRPKRPPRHKSTSNQHLEQKSATPVRRTDTPTTSPTHPEEGERPNTAIGIMQGRPLPPPPRPARSPAPPLNNLDQESIERMVGVRHYANYEDETGEPVVEEPCISRNISLLGSVGRDEDSEINVGIQTDPVPDDDFDLTTLGSFEEDEGRIDKIRYSLHGTSSDEQQQPIVSRAEQLPAVSRGEMPSRVPALPTRQQPRSPVPTEVIFPSRLHLDELEVDFLRVNELTAHSLTMDHLHSPHLQVNSLSSSGSLLVQSIQSPSLAVDSISSERLASGGIDIPNISVPPPQFYQLAPPSSPRQPRSPEEDEFEANRSTSLDTETQDDQECHPPGDGSQVQERRPVFAQRSVQAQISPSARMQAPMTAGAAPTPTDPESDDVLDLAIRLGRGLFRLMVHTLGAITDYIDMATSADPESQQKQRAHMQALICLLLILVAGIFLMTRSGSSQPRWEFYLPPPVE